MAILGLLVACSFATAVEARQGGSAIRGRITDEQKGVLPGVTIVVTHQENGTVRETTSGDDGTYLVPGLVPGPYRITAELAGFSRLTQEDLVLRIGATLQVDLSLRVGAVRGEHHGDSRISAGRPHDRAGRRQRRLRLT